VAQRTRIWALKTETTRWTRVILKAPLVKVGLKETRIPTKSMKMTMSLALMMIAKMRKRRRKRSRRARRSRMSHLILT
jgi:hypothetical protein